MNETFGTVFEHHHYSSSKNIPGKKFPGQVPEKPPGLFIG